MRIVGIVFLSCAMAGLARTSVLIATHKSIEVHRPIPEPSALVKVSLPSALRLHGAGALFVDARDAADYLDGHIKGAINVPVGPADRIRLGMSGVSIDRTIVVYCANANCGKAEVIAHALSQLGFINVSVYSAGWDKWPKK